MLNNNSGRYTSANGSLLSRRHYIIEREYTQTVHCPLKHLQSWCFLTCFLQVHFLHSLASSTTIKPLLISCMWVNHNRHCLYLCVLRLQSYTRQYTCMGQYNRELHNAWWSFGSLHSRRCYFQGSVTIQHQQYEWVGVVLGSFGQRFSPRKQRLIMNDLDLHPFQPRVGATIVALGVTVVVSGACMLMCIGPPIPNYHPTWKKAEMRQWVD